MDRWIVFCVCLVCTTAFAHAQQSTLTTRTVIDGIGIPWEILWGPDDRLWITERQGRISRVDPETGAMDVLAVLPDVHQTGESGLLGMALHPDFAAVPQVFVVYTYNDNGSVMERVVRYTYNADTDTLTDPATILDGIRGASIHDGSRLLFAPDGTLLVTTGDAAVQSLSQDHTSLNGKLLRINTDGSIPADNPWPGSSLYTTGHRNPQGLTFGPQGRLYSSEHGPNTDDEINIIEPKRNYGWPQVRGYCDTQAEQDFCTDSAVVEPIAAWTPTIAVCGLDYYNHTAIPEWQNSLLLVTLKGSRLIQLKLNDDGSAVVDQQAYFSNQFGRLRDVCVAPDGRVFISTSNNGPNNRIVEIAAQPATSAPDDSAPDHGLRASPTPAADGIVLRLTSPCAGTAHLTIVDMAGRPVHTTSTPTQPGTTTLFWNGTTVSGVRCATGGYTAVVVVDNCRYTTPVVLHR